MRTRKTQLPGQKKVLWGLVLALAVLLLVSASRSPSAEFTVSEVELLRAGVLRGEQGSAPAPKHASPAVQSHTVIYKYDEAGRLVEANYGGKSLIYTYDAAGNLLSRGIWFKVYLPLVLRNYAP